MKNLPQKYDTSETENRWQRHWLEAGTYHWDESADRTDTYVIDTPPPTVSGHLHMGHVFSYTQADFVARFQRMTGKTVFYPMGFDDNGLPTERLVEKATKKRAIDFETREAFIEACMKVSEESRLAYRDLFQSTALSVDWRQEYHTISEQSRKLAQLSFLDLHQKGHVERRMEPMMWDPIDQTAIAQAEVEDKELPSHFCDIKFPVVRSQESVSDLPDNWRLTPDNYVVIATTRPELIPACVGIFYHPDDERYQHLAGKHAITPLFGVKVPILADDTVEMEKGTGIMMCCTFGDEADIEKWRKHDLPLRLVLNKYGKMDFTTCHAELVSASISTPDADSERDSDLRQNDNLEALKGLKAKAARAKVIEMLEQSGDLIEAKPITHAVKCAERSGAPLEILPSPQWFVKVTDKKAELKAKSDSCNWHPEWMAKRMDQWIEGLSWDWCISRQRYFGVPFPVWHVQDSVVIADAADLPLNPLTTLPKGFVEVEKLGEGHWKAKNPQGELVEVKADNDVLDTWFTSSITPQLSSHGVGEYALNAERHAKLYPADMRPQAHEIIRSWAFYTLVKSHLHSDVAPWKDLMISGWCLAEDKQKMSKSKGNVVTPINLLQENGSDVVRYWASTSKLGQDTAFSKDLLKIGKKLVNKIWNATKFAAIHIDSSVVSDQSSVVSTLDKWILTRLHRTVTKATEAYEAYEYAAAMRAIEDFFWNDFCDNYLELVKKRVYNEQEGGQQADPAMSPRSGVSSEQQNVAIGEQNNSAQQSAKATIAQCLDGILRLFAPVLPHVTEELWSHLFAENYEAAGSIHARGTWPKASDYLCDSEAEAQGISAVELLEAVRKAKSEKGVSIKWPVETAVVSVTLDASARADLCGAGNIGQLTQGDGETKTESGNHSITVKLAAESDAA